MNKEIFIHIGLHKTASTTLQEYFFPRCEQVNLMLASNRDIRKFLEMTSKKDPINFDPTEAKKIIGSHLADRKINLLSSEGLSGRPWAALMEKGLDHRSGIITNLKTVFPNAKIILIIRRQDKYAISFYREYLKWGGTKKITKFISLDDEFGTSLMPIDRFDYYAYANHLQKTFQSGVCIIPFELLQKSPTEFIARIADYIGLDSYPNELPKSNETRLGDTGFEASRILNHLFRSYLNPGGVLPGIPHKDGKSWGMRTPAHFIQDNWPWRSSIKPNGEIAKIADRLLATMKHSNKKLDDEFNLNLKSYGYY